MALSDGYRPRVIDDELDVLQEGLAAISIEGAKGVGKTVTASRRAKTVHDLDDEPQRTIVSGDPALVLDSDPPVLIDEWQRVPNTWDLVRRAVDRGAEPGRFLLTGSASPRNLETHSGAGRIVSLRMRPLSLAERLPETPTVSLATLLAGSRPRVEGRTDFRLADYTDEILRSGLPGIRDLPEPARIKQLDSYLTRIVDRDFPELGHTLRNPSALRRWMTAYAAATATTKSFEKIRDAAASGEEPKPSRPASVPYRDILERLWVLDPVPGWKPTRSRIARLTEPPKHNLADPALAARLLGVGADALLRGEAPGPRIPRDGTLLGALFESLITLSLNVYAQTLRARLGHLRAYAGEHEIDLILEREDGRVLALEVKLTGTVKDDHVRHLNWLAAQLGDDLLDAVVINTGPGAYRRPDGIAVIPAALLGP